MGAINALGLAPGTHEALADMRDVWLGLRGEPDMFLVSEWVTTVLESTVGDLLEFVLSMSGAKRSRRAERLEALITSGHVAETVLVLDLLPVVGTIVDLVQAGATHLLEEVGGDLIQALRLLGDARYLFDLAPTEVKLLAHVERFGPSPGQGLPLRLVAVRLGTGGVAWMDESTSLWYSDYDAPNYDRDWGARLPRDVTSAGPGSERLSADVAIIHTTREQLLVQGAMASAAIPAVFRPGASSTEPSIMAIMSMAACGMRYRWRQSVRSMGQHRSCLVAASPLEITDPFSEIKVRRLYATAPILELVSRGVVDTVLSEVERNDLALLDTEFPA